MKISLIAAVAQNGMIGRTRPDGTPALPWHLPDDFAYFKRKTTQHPVIMGRKSMDALGKPLPNRVNIVISRRTDYQPAGAVRVGTIDEALTEARKHETTEIFVIGGAEIYALALPVATTLYLTEIHRAYEGDTRFPDFDRAVWQEVSRVPHPADDRHETAFDFVTYERRG